jgi:hypothetical protein
MAASIDPPVQHLSPDTARGMGAPRAGGPLPLVITVQGRIAVGNIDLYEYTKAKRKEKLWFYTKRVEAKESVKKERKQG